MNKSIAKVEDIVTMPKSFKALMKCYIIVSKHDGYKG